MTGDFNTAFAELRELKPPRKRNQSYKTTRSANIDMMHCEQGLHDFLRAYYHCKSADFTANHPHPLAYSTAEELAKLLPMYYVMDLDKTMPETVAPYMPSPAEITAHRWLAEDEFDFYVTEYERERPRDEASRPPHPKSRRWESNWVTSLPRCWSTFTLRCRPRSPNIEQGEHFSRTLLRLVRHHGR